MGSSRKLQGEIDRVLKKVQEGVDVFDGIWNKIYDTENANQKEKFEADLKKEIKKLQRYRDQIKTWIQSSEIKEKKALTDARKLIEREMERFKVCEKETKTKAFSKEGLGQQPKTDPREKAKAESRDWLNNMVSDLESQIDSFEAEMEGLTVKKGKTRPPRLTHLEDSISRHKQHITKLEQILRSLENDGLSPEEVNDVKEYVVDYVERNQQDFDEFAEVEDLYQSLPLDKLEALEAMEAIPVVAPAIIVKEKVAVAAASGGPTPNGTSGKSPVALPGVPQSVAAATATAAAAAITQQGSPSLLSPEEVTVEDTSVPDTASVKDLVGRPGSPVQASPVSLGSLSKEMETGSVGQRLVTSLGEGISVRGPVGQGNALEQSPPGLGRYLSSAGAVRSDDIDPPVAAESRRAGVVSDERLGSSGLTQQLATPLAGQDRGSVESVLPLELDAVSDSVPSSEAGIFYRLARPIGSRIISPSVGGPGGPPTASTFQSPSDLGQYHGRTEIAPDQKQKYLQRLQEHQQGQSPALLTTAAAQLSHLSSPSQKSQVLGPAQHQMQVQLQNLQQHEQPQSTLVQPSRSSVLQLQQTSLGLGLQPQQIASSSQDFVQQFVRPHISHISESGFSVDLSQDLSQQFVRPHVGHISESGFSEDLSKLDLSELQELSKLDLSELHPFQTAQQRSASQKRTDSSALTPSFPMNTSLTEDDSKNADTFDVVVGDPGTLAEFSQLSRDVDFPPGPAIRVEQPSKSPGVIGMRTTVTNSGPKFDSPGISLTSSPTHDQLSNKQALDAAYIDIPLPKDSERPKSYTPRYPATTPASYPQVPAAVMENPALWERLDTDVLFLAFYYQQGTFQQYLAARQLKRQSWRYHKKYNTWFQRHEEPKITTDEYEQGTYVYFDFHVVPDDFQQGWCQRIKSEFTFEYSYLEDELVL